MSRIRAGARCARQRQAGADRCSLWHLLAKLAARAGLVAPAARAGSYSSLLVSAVGCDESALVGDDDELGAVAGVEFEHGAADVGLYGQGAEEQLVGDLVIG